MCCRDAYVATMGDPASFKTGREFAAWLGLVPRQTGTGGRIRQLGGLDMDHDLRRGQRCTVLDRPVSLINRGKPVQINRATSISEASREPYYIPPLEL